MHLCILIYQTIQMQTLIELNGLEFYAYHGVSEQEKKVGNTFFVDISMEANIFQAVLSDNIKDTVSYADVYAVVKEEMEIPSNLLEHVAGRIIHSIRQHFPKVKRITVAIAKRNPPFGGAVKNARVILST